MFEVFTKRSVRPELVEGQSRTFANEAMMFAVNGQSCNAIASVRCDKALHFDKLSANGSSTDGGVNKVATNKATMGAA